MDMGSDFDDILSGTNFETEETSKKSSKKPKDKKSSKKSKGGGSKSKGLLLQAPSRKDSSKGLHGFDPIIDDSPPAPHARAPAPPPGISA
jgi:hypothetical protein